MSKINYILVAIITIFVLSSCDDNSIYDHNETVGEPWAAENRAIFDFNITDTLTAFDFYLNIRNSTDYNNSNLLLFIRTDFPDGRFSVDTAEIFLADIKGHWLGKGYGEVKDNQILFRKKGRFPMKGNYRLTFEQAMRSKNLVGIRSVGIRIVESEY